MIKKIINILTRKEKYYESSSGVIHKIVETWYDKDLYVYNATYLKWEDFQSELRFSDIKGILTNFWIDFMLSNSIRINKRQANSKINKLRMMKSLVE